MIASVASIHNPKIALNVPSLVAATIAPREANRIIMLIKYITAPMMTAIPKLTRRCRGFGSEAMVSVLLVISLLVGLLIV